MVFEEKRIQGLLRGMAKELTHDNALHEDLIQEAIIHLWLQEIECPNQTRSWYIQSCWFYLQNLLRKGRSVDSGKHRGAPSNMVAEQDCESESVPSNAEHAMLFSTVCELDLLSELSKWLTPVEKHILDFFRAGLSSREIGRRLGISHTSVIKHRQRIAALANKLGIVGLPSGRRKRPAHQENRIGIRT